MLLQVQLLFLLHAATLLGAVVSSIDRHNQNIPSERHLKDLHVCADADAAGRDGCPSTPETAASLAMRASSPSPPISTVVTGPTAVVPSPPSSSLSTSMVCNNSPLLCGRTYNSITHLGAHDSAFLRNTQELNAIAGDQFFNATLALSAGVRLLQAQVHLLNGTLFLCHTSCGLLNAGLLETWLGLISRWMDANPHDVVTLLLVNSDHQAAATFGHIFQQAGLSKYGYSHPGGKGAAWPTLQNMITANTRLVTFIASITADAGYPYLLNEFDHVFETPYMITNLAQFSNCSLDRPPSAGSAATAVRAGMLPLLNHFAYAKVSSSIQIPDVSDIDITNSPDTTGTGGGSSGGGISGTLGTQARLCTTQWGGTKPTFLLVDFFNRGPAISTADSLNGLTAVTTVGRTITKEMQPGAASKTSSSAVSVVAFFARRTIMFGAWAAAVVMFLV